MKTIRAILVAVFLTGVCISCEMEPKHVYYIQYNDSMYDVVEVTIVDEIGEVVVVVDYLGKSTSDTTFKYQTALETQPGWETPLKASSAYWCLKGL